VHPELERVYERRVTSADIHEYISQSIDALSLPGRVLGGWCDPATGRVYLDVSVMTTDLSEAMALAVEAGQLAIFDFSAMASIPVLAPVAA
jgi:hypothetical protein